MAALVAEPSDVILVADFHSHTQYSHDGRPGWGPDLGREVRQRREVVAEHRARRREPVADELAAVAGVAGEADDDAVELLRKARFSRVDYFVLVDAETLEPVAEPKGECRLIAAAVIGSTRLIDNMAV